jgi:hypothetical protein
MGGGAPLLRTQVRGKNAPGSAEHPRRSQTLPYLSSWKTVAAWLDGAAVDRCASARSRVNGPRSRHSWKPEIDTTHSRLGSQALPRIVPAVRPGASERMGPLAERGARCRMRLELRLVPGLWAISSNRTTKCARRARLIDGRLPEDRLWFNATIDSFGEPGFRELAGTTPPRSGNARSTSSRRSSSAPQAVRRGCLTCCAAGASTGSRSRGGPRTPADSSTSSSAGSRHEHLRGARPCGIPAGGAAPPPLPDRRNTQNIGHALAGERPGIGIHRIADARPKLSALRQ